MGILLTYRQHCPTLSFLRFPLQIILVKSLFLGFSLSYYTRFPTPSKHTTTGGTPTLPLYHSDSSGMPRPLHSICALSKAGPLSSVPGFACMTSPIHNSTALYHFSPPAFPFSLPLHLPYHYTTDSFIRCMVIYNTLE